MKFHILSKSILVNIRTNLINLNSFYDVRKIKLYILNKSILVNIRMKLLKLKLINSFMRIEKW